VSVPIKLSLSLFPHVISLARYCNRATDEGAGGWMFTIFPGLLLSAETFLSSSQRRLGKLSPLWRRRQQSIALSHRVYSRHEGKERIDQKRFIIIGGNKFLPPFDPLSNIIRTCFSFFFIFFFFFFFFFFSVIFVCVSILFDLIVSVGAVWVLHTCPAHRPTQAIT
jgi:hypothetical protein